MPHDGNGGVISPLGLPTDKMPAASSETPAQEYGLPLPAEKMPYRQSDSPKTESPLSVDSPLPGVGR